MSLSKSTYLVVDSLRCVRGLRLLFRDLSFSIFPGEVLQISGPNGSGKTSLLRIMAGLLRPDSGSSVCLTDRFYLGHRLALKKAFTVEENLKYDPRYKKPAQTKINALLTQVNLLSYSDKKVDTLSQGQQQRLALAKVFLIKAKLWLLDEPFVSLDANASAFWKEMIEVHVLNGGAVVISSHLPIMFSKVYLKKLELSTC